MDTNFEQAFAETEVDAPKPKADKVYEKIPEGKYAFSVSGWGEKTFDNGDKAVNIHFYIPKLNRTEWDKYNLATRMKYLKLQLTNLESLREGKGGGLKASLDAAVGRTGMLTVKHNDKYVNLYVDSVDPKDDNEVPF